MRGPKTDPGDEPPNYGSSSATGSVHMESLRTNSPKIHASSAHGAAGLLALLAKPAVVTPGIPKSLSQSDGLRYITRPVRLTAGVYHDWAD